MDRIIETRLGPIQAHVVEGRGKALLPAHGYHPDSTWRVWEHNVAALAEGVAVVIASRCPSGRVWDACSDVGGYRMLREMGCLFSSGLNGPKARIRLMVVLGAVQDLAEVPALWNSPLLSAGGIQCA